MKKLSFILVIILIFSTILPIETFGVREDNLYKIQEKLNSISKEDKQILETLFTQVQEVEELERTNDALVLEINELEDEIEDLEDGILRAEKGYERNLLALETVLKSYQKMGAGSYIEIILESDSLNNLIRRINILKDLSRNSNNLLQQIGEDQKRLSEEKEKLDSVLEKLEEKQLDIEITLEAKMKIVKEKEDYLNSLEGDRGIFIERLDYVSIIMDELKSILNEFTREFDKMIKSGGFPRNAVEESITLKGVRGRIREKKFNDIISSHENLPQMEFEFNKDIISMNVPGKELYLSGTFVVEDNVVLKFKAENGSFLDMPLRKSTMDELFREGNFLLDLKPLIGDVKIKSVEIKENYIELIVNIF